MVRPLLLICVSVEFICHRLRHYLIYVSLIMMPSHICTVLSCSRVLYNAEVEKKNNYTDVCATRHAHFTPLYFSVDWPMMA